MTDLDLDQIEARAKGAFPGPWDAYSIPVLALVARVRKAEAERDKLRRWKEEALPVLAGLQDLGRALDVPLGQRITGDLAAKRAGELRATVARVEALHRPVDLEVITGDCAAEECGHEDECPTVTVQLCVECARLAESVDTYYEEQGIGDTKYPCPTIKAIRGEQ